MLKKRLIPCLIMQNELLVQSIGFEKYLPIGTAKIAIEFVTNWDVDEIVLLDITATAEGRKPNHDLIKEASKCCFVPLTVGGGISSIEDIKGLIRAGADKISINTMALDEPQFITRAASVFGKQCIVVSIDVQKTSEGGYRVIKSPGKQGTGMDPAAWALRVQELGAGEILLNSVDRDGSKEGYDVDLIRTVTDAVDIPVIACGGVGRMEDLADGIVEGKASAVAAANIFHYIEHSTIIAKSCLRKAGIDIRLNTAAKYENFEFDEFGRILKQDEGGLESIWFEKGKIEKI